MFITDQVINDMGIPDILITGMFVTELQLLEAVTPESRGPDKVNQSDMVCGQLG
jgi:hypothetical protein